MNSVTRIAVLLLATLTACSFYGGSGEEGPNFPPALPQSGDAYVVDRIVLGEDNSEVFSLAFDIDGDGSRDNYLGQNIRLAYTYLNRESQTDLDEAVASGEMMHLLVLGQPDPEFLDTARVFLGTDPDADPSNNLSGDGELAVRPGARLDGALFGTRETDSFEYAFGDVTLENTLFGAVELPLQAAQMAGTVLADGSIEGRIGGGIAEADVRRELAPSIARSIQSDFASDCPPTTGVFPDCCEAGSNGDPLVRLFDANQDCTLEVAEVEGHSIMASLLAPDVDLDGDEINDSISVAFGFTAVRARFDVP